MDAVLIMMLMFIGKNAWRPRIHEPTPHSDVPVSQMSTASRSLLTRSCHDALSLTLTPQVLLVAGPAAHAANLRLSAFRAP